MFRQASTDPGVWSESDVNGVLDFVEKRVNTSLEELGTITGDGPAKVCAYVHVAVAVRGPYFCLFVGENIAFTLTY